MLAWTRGCGQTTEDGAYANQCLNLADDGKAHRRQAKVSNRTLGNPAVRDYRGASGNVAMVEMRSRLAYRKSESGNPPPTAGAPELYPNQIKTDLKPPLSGTPEGRVSTARWNWKGMRRSTGP
jgi:hypothetical protein